MLTLLRAMGVSPYFINVTAATINGKGLRQEFTSNSPYPNCSPGFYPKALISPLRMDLTLKTYALSTLSPLQIRISRGAILTAMLSSNPPVSEPSTQSPHPDLIRAVASTHPAPSSCFLRPYRLCLSSALDSGFPPALRSRLFALAHYHSIQSA